MMFSALAFTPPASVRPTLAGAAAAAVPFAVPFAATATPAIDHPVVASATLLAKAGADAALDDFFAILFPLLTGASFVACFYAVAKEQIEEGGLKAGLFISVFGLFTFIFFSLAID